MDNRVKSFFSLLVDVHNNACIAYDKFAMSNDNQMKYSDISTSSVKSQTTWSGVVELTDSYTINISDELVIAPCTLVKLPNTARIFVEGRLSIEGDLTCPVIIDQDGSGLLWDTIQPVFFW